MRRVRAEMAFFRLPAPPLRRPTEAANLVEATVWGKVETRVVPLPHVHRNLALVRNGTDYIILACENAHGPGEDHCMSLCAYDKRTMEKVCARTNSRVPPMQCFYFYTIEA